MESVMIDLPKSGCNSCPYHHPKVVDHIYYGETSVQEYCRLFDEFVNNSCPCDCCLELRQKSREEWIAITEEINELLAASDKKLDRFIGQLAVKMDEFGFIGAAIMAVIRDVREEFDDTCSH